MADRLAVNQSIAKGGRLTSANGAFSLVFQTDGNLVLQDRSGRAIWSPGIVGRGGVRAVMQGDGNFVVYTAQNAPVFNTGTQGRPGASLVVQDDGNVVIYHGGRAIWEARTWGGSYHQADTGNFLTKAVNTTLHAPSNLAKAVAKEVSKIAPDAAKFFKDVTQSPYWKVVAGAAVFIPGAGIAVSAGMAAATAVGKASSVKDALIGAAREAIPGGAGKAGFDAANGVLLQGKPVDQATLQFVRGQLPPEAAVGFDAAAALQAGRYAQFRAPQTMTDPKAKAAFYVAQGLRGAPRPIAVAVHGALGVSKDPTARAAFKTGMKAGIAEAKSEDAQVALTKLRAVMVKVRKKEAPALAELAKLLAGAKAGDDKAKKLLTMLAIADRANRELAGKRTPGALVHVSGVPLLTWLQLTAGYLAVLTTIPYNWVRQTFFVDERAAA
jgi:hypothetical protein